MKKMLVCLGFLMIISFPAQTANNTTLRWEKVLLQQLRQSLCEPGGSMLRLFPISTNQCFRTYDYAAHQCTHAFQTISYYHVQDGTTGTTWGKMLGMCIGFAFDMKHSYRRPIP